MNIRHLYALCVRACAGAHVLAHLASRVAGGLIFPLFGFAESLAKPSIQLKLSAAGFDPAPPTPPGEFSQFIREQVAFSANLVKLSGASLD